MADYSNITIEQRQCEANKKVSYPQKSPIKTKKVIKRIELVRPGFSLILEKDEVTEGAMFEKVVRDCKGNLLRKDDIIRLRKVGSDEWINIPMSVIMANPSIGENLEEVSDKEAIEQGRINQEKAGSKNVDKVSILEKQELSESKEVQKIDGVKKENSKKIYYIIGGISLVIIAYYLLKKGSKNG